MHDPEFCTKREFYQAVIIMHSAVKKYIERYAVLAEEMAAKEPNAKRKAELEQIAVNCHAVAGGTPKTFWQALQLFNFCHHAHLRGVQRPLHLLWPDGPVALPLL